MKKKKKKSGGTRSAVGEREEAKKKKKKRKTLHWQYNHGQYNKVGKNFKNSKVNDEGAVVGKSPVSGLAPR